MSRAWKERPALLRNLSVCSSCKRASCVQSVWPCKTPSRALLLPIETLQYLDRELETFWTEEAAARAAKPTPAHVAEKEG